MQEGSGLFSDEKRKLAKSIKKRLSFLTIVIPEHKKLQYARTKSVDDLVSSNKGKEGLETLRKIDESLRKEEQSVDTTEKRFEKRLFYANLHRDKKAKAELTESLKILKKLNFANIS